jgi:hypothetical protein
MAMMSLSFVVPWRKSEKNGTGVASEYLSSLLSFFDLMELSISASALGSGGFLSKEVMLSPIFVTVAIVGVREVAQLLFLFLWLHHCDVLKVDEDEARTTYTARRTTGILLFHLQLKF